MSHTHVPNLRSRRWFKEDPHHARRVGRMTTFQWATPAPPPPSLALLTLSLEELSFEAPVVQERGGPVDTSRERSRKTVTADRLLPVHVEGGLRFFPLATNFDLQRLVPHACLIEEDDGDTWRPVDAADMNNTAVHIWTPVPPSLLRDLHAPGAKPEA